MDKLVEVKKLNVGLKSRKEDLGLIRDLDLNIGRSQIVGLVGESGCGKSLTALSIIGLLSREVELKSGEIFLDGEDLLKKSKKEMRELRGRDISMIFQEPMRALNPLHKAGRQVEEVLYIHRKISRAEARRQVLDIFKEIGIKSPEKVYESYPHQLSGGINQRIMIAIATILEPKLLIADEPTTALDVTIQAQILALMKGLREDKGTAILLITHDLAVVSQTCDYVYVMYGGQLVEGADVRTLFRDPKHPYTKALIRSIPRVEKDLARLYSIPGRVPRLGERIQGCKFCDRCEEGFPLCRKEAPEIYELEDGHTCRCLKYKEN